MIYPKEPKLFFGTMMSEEKAYDAVMAAFEAGYKYFDFADRYENQKEIGRAISDWFKLHPREDRSEYFFQSKVWTSDIETDQTRKAINRILTDLQLNYIDCLLIHRPSLDFRLTIRAWEELASHKEQDLVKHIGVSNFDKDQILYLWGKTGVKPACNQIEFNVKNQRWDRVSFCLENNIGVQGYSPMHGAFNSKVVRTIAENKNCSEANVVTGFLKSSGISPVMKSETKLNIIKNFQGQDININQKDVLSLYNINKFENKFAEGFDSVELNKIKARLKDTKEG